MIIYCFFLTRHTYDLIRDSHAYCTRRNMYKKRREMNSNFWGNYLLSYELRFFDIFFMNYQL